MRRLFPTPSLRLIAGFGSLCLTLCFVAFVWQAQLEREALWQAQLEQQHQLLGLAVDSSLAEMRREAELLTEMVAVDHDILQLTANAYRLQQQGAGPNDPAMAPLRTALQNLLAPLWPRLQSHDAEHLYVHLAPDITVLLRVHRPEDFGDRLLDQRPWVRDALRDGQAHAGLGSGREKPGIRAASAIRDPQSGQPVGAIEISFSSLSRLAALEQRLDAGLGLLLNRQLLAERLSPEVLARLPGPIRGQWQLSESGHPELTDWFTRQSLPDPLQGKAYRLIQAQGHDYLLSLLPLPDYLSSTREPLAAALIWRDASALVAQDHAERRQIYLKWGLAWLAAQALLLLLLWSTRRSALLQADTHRRALFAQHGQTERARQLLDIIAQAQAAYINAQNQREAFDALLKEMLRLTGSAFGFIGEVLQSAQQQPYLRTYAATDIAWDDASRALQARQAASGMEFHNLDSLFGAVLRSGELLIANDPGSDPRSAGVPPGHPRLSAFIGLPIHYQQRLVGMLGLANRPGGYDLQLASELQPLLATLGQLIEALRRDAQREATQQQLERQQMALRALNEIAALPNLSRQEQLRQALRIGVEFYRMPTALISRIEQQDYLVVVQGGGGTDYEGQHFELGDTYCDLLLQHQGVLAIPHMLRSEYAEHPCYAKLGLESYIGNVIWVSGRRFGSLNFTSAEPRPQPFDEAELEFIRLLARWIGALFERQEQERERQDLLERLQQIAGQIPGMIYELHIDPDGHGYFPYVSEGVRDIYGVSPQELQQDSQFLERRVHPDDLPRLRRSIAHSREALSLWHSEYRVRHPKKGEIWVEGRAIPSRQADGSTLWHGFLADVSLHKRVDEQLSETRSFLQTVVDASTEVALIATTVDGIITLFNSGAERLLGYSAAEMVGRNSPGLFHLASEVEARGAALSAEFGRPIAGFEVFVTLPRVGLAETRHWTYVRKDGVHRRVNLTITAISGSDGQPQGFLGLATDITELDQANRSLQASESRFRSLVGSLPGVVYRCRNDANWTMLYLSEQMERLTGYPASDFIDNRVRSFAELIHPDDRHTVYETQASIARQDTFELSYRLQHADGHWVWVCEKGRGDYDGDGQLLWLNGFIWDISDQRQAELEHAASERMLSALFELAPVGITLTRLSDGQLLDSNPEFQHMLGLDPAALNQFNPRTSTPAEFLPQQQRLLEQLERNGSYGPFEKEVMRPDGSRMPVLLNGVRLDGPDGTPLLWSIVQDISQRVASEREAREREAYIRTLFNSVIDAIITTDQDGRIEAFNPAAERMFGYRAEAVLGHRIELLSPQSQRELIDQQLRAQRLLGSADGTTQRLELQGQRSNGESFPLELAVSEITYQGQRKFIGVVRDITERRRVERMKNEFVSTISHELRTPLTSIAGALGLVVGGAIGSVPAEQLRMLQIAHQNSQRLTLLINDLLDMDKLLAGKMSFSLQDQPLQPLLDEALAANQNFADLYQVRLRQPSATPAWLRVDALRLQQVLANYLSNAAKFSPPGGEVLLSVSEHDGRVRVSVTDHGPGIPAAFQERIFQKFSQADASDTRQKGGTGLGLAICKELVERMHGSLGFASQEGQGATFWFEFPALTAAKGSATNSHSS